jgi:hypothetical protein
LPDESLNDGASLRAVATQRAEDALVASVEHLRRKYRLTRSTAELVKDIKATMHVAVPPHGLTVVQTLCDYYRDEAFNQFAADEFPAIREDFDTAIQDFARAANTPARKARQIAKNAWKVDRAADRRALEAAQSGGSASPYRGRPEKYGPNVVWSFADAIMRASGQPRFSIGHHGNKTLGDDNSPSGPMFRVLVAAVEWAMTAAWMGAAMPGTAAPQVKPEGILTVIKRGRNRTD